MNLQELNALLASEEQGVAISELKNGRNSTEPTAEEYLKDLDPKGHEVNDPIKRRDKKVKVDVEDFDIDAEEANVKQITNGEGEKESYRIEPVARIALAIQKLIVKRAVAFTFGNPVTLNAETEAGSKEEDVLKAVKRVLYDTKSRTINRKVARSIYSSTEAAELWYPVEKATNNYGFASKYKLRVAIFSPLKGDKLYPYFDETGDMLAFSREYVIKDRTGVKHSYFETYTDAEHRLWTLESNQWHLAEGYPKKNQIGKIPVVYGSQPAVEWEDVQNLIDRLEKLLSNFADTNDYHAAPKIVTKGQVLGWAKKGESGAIIEMDENGSAEYLSWQQAPEAVKLEIETLLRMIWTISQTPDISWDSVKSIGAISGVALKLLFLDAHLKVQDKMEIFDDYLQRRLAIIQAFLSNMNAKDTEFKAACKSLAIEPEIVPFMIEDEKAKVDLLLAANGQKAIASRKTTAQILGWVNDVEAEIAQIEEEENAASYSDILEPSI